mmetsp:Transcript_53995/g.135729  ORF Transcript_53995/g.135729 Transcript_53995/m.135729 type:complete len:263 (-) Transcript_53995:171-959(-)
MDTRRVWPAGALDAIVSIDTPVLWWKNLMRGLSCVPVMDLMSRSSRSACATRMTRSALPLPAMCHNHSATLLARFSASASVSLEWPLYQPSFMASGKVTLPGKCFSNSAVAHPSEGTNLPFSSLYMPPTSYSSGLQKTLFLSRPSDSITGMAVNIARSIGETYKRSLGRPAALFRSLPMEVVVVGEDALALSESSCSSFSPLSPLLGLDVRGGNREGGMYESIMDDRRSTCLTPNDDISGFELRLRSNSRFISSHLEVPGLG